MGGVIQIVCVHVEDLVVAENDKGIFDVYFAQLQVKLPMNDKVYLCCLYLTCVFERDKAKGVVNMAQTALVDSLFERFGIHYELQIPTSVEFDLGLNRSNKNAA